MESKSASKAQQRRGEVKTVTILDVNVADSYAQGRDASGGVYSIDLHLVPLGSPPLPVVGQKFLIWRPTGRWAILYQVDGTWA